MTWELSITERVGQTPTRTETFSDWNTLRDELEAQGVPGSAYRKGGYQHAGYRLTWRELPTTTSEEDTAMEYVVTKSGQRKHPLRADGTVPCEADATHPATGKKADYKVCANCTAILAEEAAEQATEAATAQAAEEHNVKLRIGNRALTFIARRLDPEANAGLLADIEAATVKRAGNGFNAHLTTTYTGAAQLVMAICALHEDMKAKKVRTTQTGFRAPWLPVLARSIEAAATAARDSEAA
ncbi:hypothetical protein [Actinomadura sp. K4S16]|uniref:hypothetical protein n=1 Tax=Actinomadura sp. K4S16 TaxID=1316147 RepID=UPI0011EC2A55|nr:hypothetical protein [Actinomadura sp. K4S16]